MTISAFVEEDLPKLLDLLYGAGLDKDQWPIFLKGLVKPFDGANGVLHFFDIATQMTPLAYTFGIESEYLIGYQEYYSSCNPYPIQTFAKIPPLQVVPATTVLSKEEAVRTEFYNDWMKPQGISTDHLGCIIHQDNQQMVVLAIAPSEKRLERDGDRYRKQFELLAPHVKRVVALSKISRGEPVQNGLPAQFSCGALLVAQNRSVKAVNPPAENLLREGLLLSIDPLGRLRMKDADVQAALATALDAVCIDREPVGGPVHCRMPLTGNRVSLVVLKLPTAEAQSALVLVIVKPDDIAPLFPAQFTAAETRLASALLNGQSLSDFSDQVGVSINTARKQLAALFAKTGTNRQAALVAWLLQRNP